VVYYLSKSDFMLAQTCPTKLYYKKKGYPSEANDEYLTFLAEGGYILEKMAQSFFPKGQMITYVNGPEQAKRDTMAALQADEITLFQATLIKGLKLARVDILDKQDNTFNLIEVKARLYDSDADSGSSNIFRTKRGGIKATWRPYLEDVAFQTTIVRNVFPDSEIKPYLVMPDKAKLTAVDGLHTLFRLEQVRHPLSSFTENRVEFFGGLSQLQQYNILTRIDVSAEVEELLDDVDAAAAWYMESLGPDLQKIETEISLDCRGCEYKVEAEQGPSGFHECWGELADVKPHIFDMYHVSDIGGRNDPVVNTLIRERKASIFDIPPDSLVKKDGTPGTRNRRQLIQLEYTRRNKEWISDDFADVLAGFNFPLQFIDFETANPAVPYHAGMHPYDWVAFQWSCHTLSSLMAEPEHSEWLNVETDFPNFKFAETLMTQLDPDGTIFMWSHHERTTLSKILHQTEVRAYPNPTLQQWLVDLIQSDRLVDMNALTLHHYFAPPMQGKTAIKKVLETVWQTNPSLQSRYPQYVEEENGQLLGPHKTLPPLIINGQKVAVTEGTAAVLAYQEMLYGSGRDDNRIQDHWKNLLLQYCQLDTLAMVMIWWHWQQIIENA